MARIIVSVTNDLSTDQRVHRICTSLYDWGHDVLLVGRKLPGSLPIERPYKIKRLHLMFRRKAVFYAEYNFRLMLFLIGQKADILLANDLDTLPANYLASGILKAKLLFDSHEYFTETPEVYNRKGVKYIWKFFEKKLIPKIYAGFTVSGAIAGLYKKEYNQPFEVIRNVPLQVKEPRFSFTENNKNKRIILYQGTLNIGRGLDLMIKTLPLVKDCILWIIGDGPDLSHLEMLVQQTDVKDQVQFHGKILPENLWKLTSRADIGISLEEPIGLSYKSALPNKLFDYIQNQVPVIVSDLPEMAALVRTYSIGLILKERTTEHLASLIREMLQNETLRHEWKANLKTAARELCWENESIKLKNLINSVLT